MKTLRWRIESVLCEGERERENWGELSIPRNLDKAPDKKGVPGIVSSPGIGPEPPQPPGLLCLFIGGLLGVSHLA